MIAKEQQLTIDEAYSQAVDHFDGNRYQEADQLCTAILQTAPNHINSLMLLGVIAQRVDRHDLAAIFFQKSLDIDDGKALHHYNLATALYTLGRKEEASKSIDNALKIEPDNIQIQQFSTKITTDYADEHYNLGVTLHSQGKIEQAIPNYQKAIAIQADHGEADQNLVAALLELGRAEAAVASLEQAVAIQPDNALAHNNLGVIFATLNRYSDAIASYQNAIALQADYAQAHYNLGSVFDKQGNFAAAIASYNRAITLKPDYAQAHNNIGNSLKSQNRLDAAIASYQAAIAIDPDFVEAHCNLGVALHKQGNLTAAIASGQKAIAINPDYAQAHHNLGLSLLLLGDMEAGLREYEYRWQCPGHASYNYQRPQWLDSRLDGETILIHQEQGFGDNIQFIRYVELLKQKGAQVAFICPEPLLTIFQTVKGIDHLLAKSDSIPHWDCHIPLLSLPLLFGTTMATIPAKTPYLYCDPVRVAKFRKHLANLKGFKVGIAWRGNPDFIDDKNRSVGPTALAKLLDIEQCSFISLQKEPEDGDLQEFAGRKNFYDISSHLKDFADTAAVMANLDLVISSDTSIVHLAGALALPVWVLLMHVPDWRWLLNRADNPWYPKMRLFRQPSPNSWQPVVAAVEKNLRIAASTQDR